MPLAYWCLLIAGLLPYAWALVAKLGAPYDNHRPREVLAHAQGHRKRANWAQANAFESLPLFIAAVLVASLQHADAGTLMRTAREEGMLTMYEDGCLKALSGVTSIDEVIRVTQEG